MSIIGLGPHGERAQPAESLRISEEDGATARARQFQVAVVLHSTNSDWAKQQLAGIVKTLGDYSAILSEVVNDSNIVVNCAGFGAIGRGA